MKQSRNTKSRSNLYAPNRRDFLMLAGVLEPPHLVEHLLPRVPEVLQEKGLDQAAPPRFFGLPRAGE